MLIMSLKEDYQNTIKRVMQTYKEKKEKFIKEINLLKEKEEKVSKECEKAKNQIESDSHKYNEIKEKNEYLTRIHSDENTARVKIELKLNTIMNQVISQTKKLNSAEEEIKALTFSLKEREIEVVKLKEIIKSIRNESKDIENIVGTKSTEVRKLIEIEKISTEKIVRLEKALEEKTFECLNYVKEISEITGAKSINLSMNEGILKELEIVKSQNQLFKKNQQESKIINDSICKELLEYKKKFEELNLKKIECSEKYESAENQRKSFENKIIEMKYSLENITQERDELLKKYEELNINYKHLNINYVGLEENFKKIQDNLNVITCARRELEVKFESAKKEVETSEKLLKTTEEKATRIRKDNENKKFQLNKIDKIKEEFENIKRIENEKNEAIKKQLRARITTLTELLNQEMASREEWASKYNNEHKENMIAKNEKLNLLTRLNVLETEVLNVKAIDGKRDKIYNTGVIHEYTQT